MAYAAVISLRRTIQRLENPINKPQITKSAYQELDSLRSMLKELDKESSRSIDRRVVNELDAKIREAVWKVEDVLESYYSLIPPSQGRGHKGGLGVPIVDEIDIEMDSFLKTVKMLREEYNRVLLQNALSGEEEYEALSSAVPPVNKSTTVGLSDLSQKIRNELLDGTRGLKTVSLVGMAGIAEKSFPPQLEKPGRKIAENCEGLPLLILAVANILRGLDKTQEYWKMVAERKTTTFTDANDQIYEVLLPSYEYLFQHLKACFLYMGVFPMSCEIPLCKLINLWDVEDFLEPRLDQNLEKCAMKYMKALVSNSVAIVCKQSFESVRRMKSSKLHSVNWYLCVTEARKNRLFHVLNKLTDVYIERPRRLVVQNNMLLGLKEVYDSMAAVTSTTRSLLCTGEDHQYPVRICFNMMLLKVLDALAIRFYEFPNEVLRLLQLRYLTLTHNGELPSAISKLQQLQCLILRRHHNIIKLVQRDSNFLPEKIWEIPELRHVRIMGSNLPDPSKDAKLPNLSTLYVNANSCSENVFRSIPNLKKLGITVELEPDAASETVRCFEHIKLLKELESLKCVVVNPRLRSQLVVAPPEHLSNLFVCHLKKLSLNGLGYPWEYMTAIGSLISLQVLKLRCSAFQGADWETKVGQFKCLKYLLLEDIDLVHWTVEFNCFRSLCHLSVRNCYKLKKVPCEIGDNPILKMLEVDDCSPSVVDSAQQIQLNTKYSHLQVVINSSWNL